MTNSKSGLILLLESATKVCSVALARDNKIVAIKESAEGNRHSEWMTSFINELMYENQIQYQDLSAIAVSSGPGSYTGLRVGYSIAKGLAYSLSIPMIAVDTLESLALEYLHTTEKQSGQILMPMIDARRMEVYFRSFDHQANEVDALKALILDDECFNNYTEYNQLIFLGDGAWKVHELNLDPLVSSKVKVVDILCSAKNLVHQAWSKWSIGEFEDVAYCVPLYLKSPNITTPNKNKLPL